MDSRNTRKIAAATLLAPLLMVLTASLVLAGGWATVTLDELPREPRAGETMALGLTIRQHGFREIDLDVTFQPVYLFAENPETGETLRFDAVKDGNTGHFLVDVMFPEAGQWTWGAHPSWFPEFKFEPLTVLPPAPPVTAFDRLFILLQSMVPVLPPQVNATSQGASESAEMSGADQVSYGEALFVAKGCSGCHRHRDVSVVLPGSMLGPNLTHRPLDPAFLRVWLADPASVRPDTIMPNLGLDNDEIEALIAFLKQG